MKKLKSWLSVIEEMNKEGIRPYERESIQDEYKQALDKSLTTPKHEFYNYDSEGNIRDREDFLKQNAGLDPNISRVYKSSYLQTLVNAGMKPEEAQAYTQNIFPNESASLSWKDFVPTTEQDLLDIVASEVEAIRIGGSRAVMFPLTRKVKDIGYKILKKIKPTKESVPLIDKIIKSNIAAEGDHPLVSVAAIEDRIKQLKLKSDYKELKNLALRGKARQNRLSAIAQKNISSRKKVLDYLGSKRREKEYVAGHAEQLFNPKTDKLLLADNPQIERIGTPLNKAIDDVLISKTGGKIIEVGLNYPISKRSSTKVTNRLSTPISENITDQSTLVFRDKAASSIRGITDKLKALDIEQASQTLKELANKEVPLRVRRVVPQQQRILNIIDSKKVDTILEEQKLNVIKEKVIKAKVIKEPKAPKAKALPSLPKPGKIARMSLSELQALRGKLTKPKGKGKTLSPEEVDKMLNDLK